MDIRLMLTYDPVAVTHVIVVLYDANVHNEVLCRGKMVPMKCDVRLKSKHSYLNSKLENMYRQSKFGQQD